MQHRVIIRRIGLVVLAASAAGAVAVALEAAVRGRLVAPAERVPSMVVTRPVAWGSGERVQPVVLGGTATGPVELRRPVRLGEVPDHLVDAVLAVEDQRFHDHGGLDLRRIGGALVANIRAGGIAQGGSTLTQQLAKNLFLTRDRTLLRKIREAALALALEARHDKAAILEAYFNEIYLGQDGARPIHGVGAASRYYFNKDVRRLSLAEAALLAGMIQAPNRYVPTRHPGAARQRRDLVLQLMTDQERVTRAEAQRARRAALPTRVHPAPAIEGRWFRDHLRASLPSRLPARGVAVYTTLDATLQRHAERAVLNGLGRIRASAPDAQAALVALDPRSGEILAMVGGRSYGGSQFNRATRARRQPGSAFKPVVALAALERGERGLPLFTLASRIEDTPLDVPAGGVRWQPANYDGQFRGEVTLRQAMEESLNVPFARIGLRVGPERIAATGRRLGIDTPLRPVPSLALGSSELSPLELARAYGVLAAAGELAESRLLFGHGPHGAPLPAAPAPARTAVADPAAAYLVTSSLQGVVARGTGRALGGRGRLAGIAGKTGTSNAWRDAWFVAYTPSLVVAVWVGHDDGRSLGQTGASAALPIAAGFLDQATPRQGWAPFPVPPGVTTAFTSTAHDDWSWDCGTREYFLEGTEPEGRGCIRLNDPFLERFRGWSEEVERRASRLIGRLLAQTRESNRANR